VAEKMNYEPNIHGLMEILAKEPPRYKFDRVREGAIMYLTLGHAPRTGMRPGTCPEFRISRVYNPKWTGH